MDRILNMIKSSDIEMKVLGIRLALEQGENWCLKNLSPEALGTQYTKFGRTNTPIHMKGNVGIRIIFGHLVCKERQYWHNSVGYVKIIDHDIDE